MNNAGRHATALAVVMPVLATLPWFAVRLSWALSAAFGESGGVGDCCTPVGVQSEPLALFSNPFQPGLIVALVVVAAGGLATQAASHRHGAAWVVVPGLVAVSTGAVLGVPAWLALPAGLSEAVPVIIGLVGAVCLGFLQAVYVAVLWNLRPAAPGA